ncbi:hypothetical protein GDO81_020103 [Engystomops pustulosus]|uniref:Uncharacterized protein n=1 Tax=Engystomops pustulosus TaxID=76066 RepID=A0AAV6ZEZ0_ENGPU|nr:hypothetical protein GDO81_020103 [Engystomops pustulosus]
MAGRKPKSRVIFSLTVKVDSCKSMYSKNNYESYGRLSSAYGYYRQPRAWMMGIVWGYYRKLSLAMSYSGFIKPGTRTSGQEEYGRHNTLVTVKVVETIVQHCASINAEGTGQTSGRGDCTRISGHYIDHAMAVHAAS